MNQTPMNQTQKNAELVTEIFRSFELGKLDRCKELVSPACKIKVAGNALDRDSWLGFGSMFMTAFPDGRHVWEKTEAVGDYVLINGYFTGTHRAPFQGIPATGKTVKFSATMIEKVIDGKLVEHTGDFDSGALMQQLGGSEAQNRAIVEKMLAAVDAQDWPAILELVSPACKTQIGAQSMDRDGWMAMGKAFYAGFPDGKHTIEEVVATGDRVVVFARWGGTHRGEFQGVPATGRRVSITAIQAYKLEGGKIVEHRGEFDAASMMQQLTA